MEDDLARNESQPSDEEIGTTADNSLEKNSNGETTTGESSSEATVVPDNGEQAITAAETDGGYTSDHESDSADCNDDVLEQFIVDPDEVKAILSGEVEKKDGSTPSLVESSAVTEMPSSSSSPEQNDETTCGQSTYHIKWFLWKGVRTPIITQNENGPCPLLAVMNVLLLTGRVTMPSVQEFITTEQIMEYLGDRIIELAPKNLSEEALRNYECNMHDAMAFIPKLQTGIDVNVKFTGVKDFEYTPELIVFDLMSIGLYHGWLVDPQNKDLAAAVGSLSYNQLVEKIIASKQADVESELVSQGLAFESFLQQTASQLTYHGLCELNTRINNEEICVFFRNNHFSTLYKHNKELFLLVTDQGFLTEDKVIWETLSNIEGDGNFVDADFNSLPMSRTPLATSLEPISTLTQLDQDYMIALSLQQENENYQELSDAELAMRLQEEENRRHQAQAQAPRPAPSAVQQPKHPHPHHPTHGPKQQPPPAYQPPGPTQSRSRSPQQVPSAAPPQNTSPQQATTSSGSTQRQSDKSNCVIL